MGLSIEETAEICEAGDYPLANMLEEDPDPAGRIANQYTKNFIKYLKYIGDSDFDNYHGCKYPDDVHTKNENLPYPQCFCICTWLL